MLRRISFTIAAAVALTATRTAAAQISVVARTPAANATQLTFGYLCDDRFVVRNDGESPVDVEYGLEKGTEHTKLTVNGHETVELASKSKDAVELWVDGKLVARARKDRRSCKDVPGSSAVTVTPLEVPGAEAERPVYAYPYPYPYGLYDPWGYGYYGSMGFGFRYTRVVGVPVMVGGGGRGGPGRHR